jgi:hypothetical protein
MSLKVGKNQYAVPNVRFGTATLKPYKTVNALSKVQINGSL